MRFLLVSLSLMVIGCASIERPTGEDFDRYVEFCRETAMTPVGSEDPNDPMSKVDWMVGASATTQEFDKEYKIVYADRDYLSFYTKEYSYLGGAHGNTVIRVGTIQRSTGKIVKLRDLVPDEQMVTLSEMLRMEVVKKIGGQENLQGEVKPTDNFYLDKDGLHFVYNEFEIACYAAGSIEVCVNIKRR